MEIKDKVIIGLVILIVCAVLFSNSTGSVIKNKSCTDRDGRNYLTKEETQSMGIIKTETRIDDCATKTAVREYYCDNNNNVVSEIIDCTKIGKSKCELGKCI